MVASEGIQVAIRMRPLNSSEKGKHASIWKVLKDCNSIAQTTVEGELLPDRAVGRNFFSFQTVFGEDSTTKQVYDSVVRNIVSSVCTGLNGTMFAYGQTSSGKTFTMQGSGTIKEGSVSGTGGVVHMAAHDIFTYIAQHAERNFSVKASFLEIYNEEVLDLLTKATLHIKEDTLRGVFVDSEQATVESPEELLEVFARVEKSRSVASTARNERSSRSHTIFRLTIESTAKESEFGGDDEDEGAVRVSTLNLVDLAGSESVRHTGATGDRRKEGGMINKSLLALSRVVVALGTKNKTHINFRDSKLTRLLQPSLRGNARMSIICCATASRLYAEETKSTFSFASRAKLIKTSAQVNEIVDSKTMIRRLQRELAEARRLGGAERVKELESELTGLQHQVKQQEEEIKRLHTNQSDDDFDGDDDDGDDESIPISLPSLPASENGLQPCILPSSQQSSNGPCEGISPPEEGIDNEAPSTERESVATHGADYVILNSEKSLMREVQNLKEQLDAINNVHEASLHAIQTELETAKKELQKEGAARETVNIAFDSLQSETLLMEKSVTDLQLALKNERAAVKRLKAAEKELEVTNGSLLEHNLELLASVNQLETDLELRVGDSAKEIETLRSDKTTLEEQLREAESQSQIGKNELESLRTANIALEKQLAEAQDAATGMDESLNNRLKNEVARNDKLMIFVKEIEASRTQLANDKALAEASVAALKQQVQTSNELAETLKQQFDQAKTVFTNTEVTLKRGMEGYQVEIQNLRQQLGVSKQEIASLNEKLAAYPEKKADTAAPHWTIVVNKKQQVDNPNPATDIGDIPLVTRDENMLQENTTILNNFYATQTRMAVSPSSTQQFICWHDNSTGDKLRWTALFVCPLLAEVFLAAPYTLRTTPAPGKEPFYKDDLFWFPNKNMAKCGAAGRVLDCFAYRQSGLCIKRYGCAIPYKVPMEYENVRRILGSKEQELLDLLLQTAVESANSLR